MNDKIKKLPKWVQEYIRDLERQRATAVRVLNEFCDNQTPSPFEVSEHVCTGEKSGPSSKKTYVQARSITINHADITLRITTYKKDKIQLQYGRKCGDGWDHVALIPRSHMNFDLMPVSPEATE